MELPVSSSSRKEGRRSVHERLGERPPRYVSSTTGHSVVYDIPVRPEERESDDEMVKNCCRKEGQEITSQQPSKTFDRVIDQQDGTSLNNPRMTGPRMRRTLQESAYVADVTLRNLNDLGSELESYPLPKNNIDPAGIFKEKELQPNVTTYR